MRDPQPPPADLSGGHPERLPVSLRILHAPRNDAAIGTGLAIGEAELGHRPRVLTYYRQFTRYPGEQCLDLGGRSRFGQLIGHLQAFLANRTGYDVYNFGGGATFLHYPRRGLNLLDLPFIDRDAIVVFTFTGSDARSLIGSGSAFLQRAMAESVGGSLPRRSLRRREAARRRSIDKAARRADHFFAVNPDLLRGLPEGASFLPYPLADFDRLGEHRHRFFRDDKVHIAHAPTRRALKGTKFVLEAIEHLEPELGDRFSFTLLEGLPHDEALQRYREADLFVDQLLIGWYGMVATEVMRMGIPVVAFIDDDHLHAIPSTMSAQLPVIRADPSNLAEMLRGLILERDQLPEVGRRCRAFVESWHDPLVVARQAVAHYRPR